MRELDNPWAAAPVENVYNLAVEACLSRAEQADEVILDLIVPIETSPLRAATVLMEQARDLLEDYAEQNRQNAEYLDSVADHRRRRW